jgi:WD40 repeat protein
MKNAAPVWTALMLTGFLPAQEVQIKGHDGEVVSLAFSPDSRTLASTGEDRTIKLWEVLTGKERLTLRGHTDKVLSVAFSPDGKTLASGGTDRSARVWDLAAGKERLVKEFKALHGEDGRVHAVAVSPDGGTLAVGTYGGQVTLWDLSTGKQLSGLRGHPSAISGLAFTAGGTLVSGSCDTTVRLWNVRTGEEKADLKGGEDEFLQDIAVSADGRLFATLSEDGPIRLWDVTTTKVRDTLPGKVNLHAVALSPDGKLMALGDYGLVRVWDTTRRKEPVVLSEHEGKVYALAFSPNGRLLASGCSEGRVKVWDMSRLKP